MAQNNSKSGLYAIIAILVVAVIGFAVYTMQQKADEPDLSIDVSDKGIEIKTD